MDLPSEDRRDGKRFKLRLACVVSSPSRHFERINGTTSDISRTGVRVVFSDKTVLSSFHPGDIVSIEIDLPQSPYFSPRSLECLSRVVRVEADEADSVAVAFVIVRNRVRERDESQAGAENEPGLLQ
ncbi:MAG: PilZ domain-containing protein [Bryobacteraceae bacterium]